MNIQSLTQIKVAEKDGNIHQDLFNYLGQNMQQLQNTFSNEGYELPVLTNTQIASLNPAKSKNRIFINGDTNQLIVNLGGVFKVVQVV